LPYFSQHAAAFQADPGRVIDRDFERARRASAPVCRLPGAARQLALLACPTWTPVSFT